MNWHRTAFLFLLLSLAILLLLAIFLGISTNLTGISGFTTVYQGKCSSTSSMNAGLQFAVAVISVIISVSTDFFLRLAISPTPHDISKAHTQNQWLDIGTHSLRNMRFVSRWRTLTWILLVVSSAPLQLFSHASVFAVSVYPFYEHILVAESYFDGAAAWYPGVANPYLFDYYFDVLNDTTPLAKDFRAAKQNWDRLDPTDCWDMYLHNPSGLQNHRHLVLVVENAADPHAVGWTGAQLWSNSSTEVADEIAELPGYDPTLVNSVWSMQPLCQADILYNGLLNDCADDYGDHGAVLNLYDDGDDGGSPAGSAPEPWTYPWISPTSHDAATMNDSFGEFNLDFNQVTVKYCLAEPFVSRCKVYLANPILLMVLGVVVLKVVLSAFAFYMAWGLDSIQTLGDAVQLFMEQDVPVQVEKTTGLRQDMEAKDGGLVELSPLPPLAAGNTSIKAREWVAAPKYWHTAVRRAVWLWTMTPCVLLVLGVSITIIVLHLRLHLKWNDYAFGEDMNNHYLNFYTSDYDPSVTDISSVIIISLLANLSQLLITPIYFLLNALNTIMFQSRYWASFALGAKRLRVSFPRGKTQRGGYVFGYPLAWGLTLTVLRTMLGWLFTQAIFMLPRGRLDYQVNQTEIKITDVGVVVGYSVEALVATIGVSIAVFFVLPVLISYRRLPASSVVVGTNSLVIAGQCLRVLQSQRSPTVGTSTPGARDKEKEGGGGLFRFSSLWEIQSPVSVRQVSTFRNSADGPRYLQPLEWGVLDAGDRPRGRPGYLGLGTKNEILGKPVEGQVYEYSSVEEELRSSSGRRRWSSRLGMKWPWGKGS
ncbi:hypothetical protein B0H66DRAFT_349215 [Apodospora peruviana]|uniref:DUF6536 domain-containing protein n=1 Tax=Apodospora peruviana TaxID=516989 RepID=A0AAE0HUV2_9PEZI|nr:hypothetical protein B0H66DRAFT_349215 [Apodospora peruviana]